MPKSASEIISILDSIAGRIAAIRILENWCQERIREATADRSDAPHIDRNLHSLARTGRLADAPAAPSAEPSDWERASSFIQYWLGYEGMIPHFLGKTVIDALVAEFAAVRASAKKESK